MDSGEGKFVQGMSYAELLERKKEFRNPGGIFTVGELVKLKGSTFRIKAIKPDELRLKLLKKDTKPPPP